MPLSPEQRAKGRQEQAKFLHRAADHIESLKGKEFETADELSDAFTRYWRKLPERPDTREPYEGIFDLTLPVEPANQALFPAGFKIPETQLSAPNYPVVISPVLGKLTITSGFMEPHGHSQKPACLAMFGDPAPSLRHLPASYRNLGIDYYVEDHRILSWFNGEVLSVAVEGSYGNRCRVATDRHYLYNGKSYPVIVAYAHAEHFSVKQGQKVVVGQRLGTQGGTGAGGEPQYPDHVDLRLWIDTEDGIIDLSPNLFIGEAEPVKKPDSSDLFEKALAFTLEWEGGFVDNPADPGGRTNKGITQSTYNAYLMRNDRDVKNISDREVREIYYRNYWLASKANLFVPALAIAHFDTAVNFGVGGAIQFLQEVLGLPADGIFGEKTAALATTHNNPETALAICEARKAYRHKRVAEKPSQRQFLAGWLNRDTALERHIENV